jgi:hypothetical protein
MPSRKDQMIEANIRASRRCIRNAQVLAEELQEPGLAEDLFMLHVELQRLVADIAHGGVHYAAGRGLSCVSTTDQDQPSLPFRPSPTSSRSRRPGR